MFKRLCLRDYAEEKRWKRRCEREEMFSISLVSVKMTGNRVVSVPSTTRTRQYQLSIQ
jgi:hypothetical protein